MLVKLDCSSPFYVAYGMNRKKIDSAIDFAVESAAKKVGKKVFLSLFKREQKEKMTKAA